MSASSKVHAEINSKEDVWNEASKVSGVPVKILHGIALVESGKRWTDGLIHPWPWTLNSPVKGSQFFNTKAEAADELNSLIALGIKNIDIGLMQINCGYHCNRVEKPSDLLDPKLNIKVASKILAEVKKVKGDLAKTVGAYHAGLHPSRENRSLWYQNVVAMRVRNLSPN